MDALTTYKLLSANKQSTLDRVAKRPDISREVSYYNENISQVKSVDDLVGDNRLFRLVMQAYGLQEMAYAKGFIRKLLESGTDDPNSMANRLTDQRYKELANDFNFVRYSDATTAFSRVTKGVIEKLYRQSLETDAGNLNNGARLALYFERKADSIDKPGAILGDIALLKFTQTAFGLPETMSFLSFEKQEKMISERLNLESLKDPEKISSLVQRFLINWDIKNPQQVEVPPLLGSPIEPFGLPVSLLTFIQQIRKG